MSRSNLCIYGVMYNNKAIIKLGIRMRFICGVEATNMAIIHGYIDLLK
jgi:hypothetical protein